MGNMIERKKKIMMMQGQGELPIEYRKINYIEGTGTQYIKTNYTPGGNLSIDFKFEFTGTFSGDKMVFGAYNGSGAVYFEVYDAARTYAANGNAQYSNPPNTRDKYQINTKLTGFMNSQGITINGITDAPQRTSVSVSIPIYLFAWNNKNSTEYIHTKLRLYSLKFTEGSAVSANFVPCIRKSDDKPGMYETVSGTFYTNAGTGEFIVPQ